MTTATETKTAASSVQPARLAIWGAIALMVNIGIFLIGDAQGASWDVGQPYPISLPAVVAATLVVFVVLGALVWFISAKRPGFARLAAWAGLAVGVLSMLSLINAAYVTTAVSLGAMHLVTAIAWVVALIGRDPRTIPTREQP